MELSNATRSSLLLMLIMLCSALLRVHSLPTGAPLTVCETMHPQHQGIPPRDHSASPFSIQHTDTYIPGSINTISIQSNDPSRTIGGILLQARKVGSRDDASGIVGIWILLEDQNDRYQVLECTNPADTITHRKINNDTSVDFLWIAPLNLTERIEFLATVVAENFLTFWVQLTSDQTLRSVNEPATCSPADYCSNGGTCGVADNGEYICVCAPGYTGVTCDEVTCLVEDYCGDHGVCHVINGQDTCFCPPGYTGETCNILVTACTSRPCFNGGVCNVGANGTFECACPEGRDGDRCQFAVCVPADYCKNGGTCQVSESGDYECGCVPGYIGPKCDTAVCVPSDYCRNGGACEVIENEDYICTCTPGFTGPTCEEDVDECLSEPCNSNGVCVNGVNGYECQCNQGFSGPTCEIYCTSDFNCENGGSCGYEEEVGRVQCTCSPGFVGVRCQFAIMTDATEPPSGGRNGQQNTGKDEGLGPELWWLVLGGFAVVLVIVFLVGFINAQCKRTETSSSK